MKILETSKKNVQTHQDENAGRNRNENNSTEIGGKKIYWFNVFLTKGKSVHFYRDFVSSNNILSFNVLTV